MAVVVLREIVEADVPELRRIHATDEVVRWWDRPEEGFPLTDEPEAGRFTIEVDGAVGGMIQFVEELEPNFKHVGVDLFLDPELHGHGIGTEALNLIVRYLIEELGHHRVTIDPAVTNETAVRAYEKVGFKRVGVMRQYERVIGGEGWRDAYLMDLLADDAGAGWRKTEGQVGG